MAERSLDWLRQAEKDLEKARVTIPEWPSSGNTTRLFHQGGGGTGC